MTYKNKLKPVAMLATIALLIFSLINLAGCHNNDAEDYDDEVERCWQYAQKNPDGFTINILTYEAPTEGIVVSYAATQNSFDKKDLKKVIDHAKSHAHLVGGWYNSDNQKYYFDSDTIFLESMLEEALIWGKRNNQLSVYILSENRSVDIK